MKTKLRTTTSLSYSNISNIIFIQFWMHCIELCIVCDVLEIKPKVKIHSPVQTKVSRICNLSNHHGDNESSVSTAKWSRDNYAELWNICWFRTKYTIYVFTREATFDKDFPKFFALKYQLSTDKLVLQFV